jgi:hypothetical protein
MPVWALMTAPFLVYTIVSFSSRISKEDGLPLFTTRLKKHSGLIGDDVGESALLGLGED